VLSGEGRGILKQEYDVTKGVLEGIIPARGLAFIRHIEVEDTYRGGSIIVPDQVKDKITKQQFIVVAVGDYERCEDPEECPRPHHKGWMHKHHLMQGDWVLARNRSWMQTPDDEVFVIRQGDILGTFREG
jgi:co-chaperonin GroES (HSP10)